MGKTQILDKQPTMREWPVRIWEESEIKPYFAEAVRKWLKGTFDSYEFVYAPKRSTNPDSYVYMFGYGNDEVFYMRKEMNAPITFSKEQVISVSTERELLNAGILVNYQDGESQKKLEFPYVPSVYYLYDPFLNWLLGLEKDFTPMLAEKENPRPDRLYNESLVMYNYSIGAYRLGDKFTDYSYNARQYRCKWMPWKKDMEEWLEIPMERGTFKLHTIRYLTECSYEIGITSGISAHKILPPGQSEV